ncbi:hypothetical protein PoB_004438300 [Plakobranchus ocellatus]|uniref:Uncharacterized protein n=1 Tax=Plakobranchus ocellatus TaxID=259542 RepID=A0AAV4BGB2_9GAST|nr:hypothetical protein PoB_004438300 [Plakobranchus ocellatus]
MGSRLLKRVPETPSGSEIEENLNSALQCVSLLDIDHDESSEPTHFYAGDSEPESNTDMLMRVARALENETSNIDNQVSKNHEEIEHQSSQLSFSRSHSYLINPSSCSVFST